MGTSSRRPVFTDLSFGHACIQRLKELRDAHSTPVHAYCLMPDHVHLLVGSSSTLSLSRLVQSWKSLCYRERRSAGEFEPFWQRGYFDHVVRQEEDLRAAAQYILDNPVRAGLVADFREYPLCGSLEWTVR